MMTQQKKYRRCEMIQIKTREMKQAYIKEDEEFLCLWKVNLSDKK